MKGKPRFPGSALSVVVGGFLGLSAIAGIGWAGQQEASIIGQVTDDSGGVVPGVTVSATSPALQVPEVSAVTNERGEYRLSPLPIGTYQVLYTLGGFQTVKQENIRLTLGFVAKVDVVMKVGALEESVTVSGSSPVVDATSTGTVTQLTKETLELIPSTRNSLLSLMAQAPGARGILDEGGSNFAAIPTFHAYGQDGDQWLTLEGVLTTTPNGSGSGNYWDYTSFEETRVQAIGKGADVAMRGIQMNAIVKSGGNDFHGSAFYSDTNHRFQSVNIDHALALQGIASGNQLETRWDTSGELGGPIVHNRLWFYGSVRRRYSGEDILGVSKPDGSPAVFSQGQIFHTEKISYQMTSQDRFVGFYTHAVKTEDGTGVSPFVPWMSRRSGRIPTATYKVQWQGVRGNLVTSLQYGHWYYFPHYQAYSGGAVSTMDLVTMQVTGDAINSGDFFRGTRAHTTGSVSWYKSNGPGGNHELKAGFDYVSSDNSTGQSNLAEGNYQLVFSNGVPTQLTTWNAPTFPHNFGRYLGTYVEDNWTIARRLTFNLGLRAARDNSYVPAQCREAGIFAAAACIDTIPFKIWYSLAPRLSAAYDLNGNGKTVVKGGWGRYIHMRDLREVEQANPNAKISTTYRWHDSDGDKLYQPGEVNFDPNGSDYLTQGGTASAVAAPNETQPKIDQYFVSLERELISNFAVRVTGMYVRSFDIARRIGLLRPYDVYSIPITNPDPGPDNKIGTADDPGTLITYYDYPAAYSGKQFDTNMLDSPPGQPNHTFKTIEIAGSKRFTRGWTLNASYSATKKNIVPAAENLILNPNTEIFMADRTWEWLARASGAYVFPHDVTTSVNFEHRSGDPQARQVFFTGGKQIPNITLNVGPIGSLRLPNVNALDLRAEKAFRLLDHHKLTARLNIYNALNANTITAWTVRSGTNYLKPTAILPPRVFELSASYTF